MPQIYFTAEAEKNLKALRRKKSQQVQLKAVLKTLGLMETNLRHPSLHTHKYHSIRGVNGEEIYEAYAQNRRPGAFRVFWHYGPGQDFITVVAITPHP